MRKILTLILVPIIFFCGCSEAKAKVRLTKEEYKTAFMSAWREFNGGTMDYVKISEVSGSDFSEFKAKAEELQKACDRMYDGLRQFEEIFPPQEFEERHKRLLKSAEDEKRWVSYREQCFNAATEEESNIAANKIAEEINAIPYDELLPYFVVEIYKELGGIDSGNDIHTAKI